MFLDVVSPSAVNLTFEANTRSFKNPINRKDQFAKLQGDRWKATLVFDNLNQDKTDTYVAWIMSLNGQVGTFNCPVVTQSITTISTVVSSTNSSVRVDNIGNLKIGKYFSLNDELKAITSIDGNTINFKPNFRTNPSAGQVLMTNKPTFRARLAKDEARVIASTSIKRAGKTDLFQSFAIDAVEDL